jgi:uncharacterized membrane protein
MKKDLLAGIAILLPIILTFFVLTFFIDLCTNPFLDMVSDWITLWAPNINPQHLPYMARLITLVLLVIAIFLSGMIAQWFFVRTLIQKLNGLISRIPVVRTIYKVAKDILHALLSKEGRKAFKHSVVVPFPSKKSHTAGLSSGEVPKQIAEKIDQTLEPVFIPTAPHLISGFLVFFPKDKTKTIPMTHQEFVKYVISCGLVIPEKTKKK